MKTAYITGMGILLVALALAVSSCKVISSSESTDESSSGESSKTPAALSTFGEEVVQCTPQIQAGGGSYTEAENTGSITAWSGWDVTQQRSIFSALLTTNSAEGLYDPIGRADTLIALANGFISYWQTSGSYDDITLPFFNTSATLTVDTGVKRVTIPFFGGSQAVDRLITLEGTLDGTQDTTIQIQMAFTTSTDGETLVMRIYLAGNGETSMFYGRKTSSGERELWAACFADQGTTDPSDDVQMALKWKGYPVEKRFALTQYKNSGNTKILAGGSLDGDMAFLAQLSAAHDTDAGGNPYYLICMLADITQDSSPYPVIVNGALTAPHESDNTVLKYIEEDNPACLGFLTAYPQTAADVQDLN